MRRVVLAGAAAIPVTVLGLALSSAVLLADPAGGAPQGIAVLRPGSVPIAYVNDLETAAAGCPGLSPALLAAQLQQESGFDPNAVSPVGAQGIAQFMPGTWLSYGIDADGDGAASPFDPEDAIAAQGRLMCELLDLARGSGLPGDPVALALAGYNAGWGAVAAAGGVPPYAETQAYVAAIVAALPQFEAADQVSEVALPIGRGSYTLGARFGDSGDLWANDHTGQDFITSCGTPVVAVTAGTANISTAEATWAGPHHVKVTGSDGTQTWYAHMSGTTIMSGQTVRAGQQVGYVGTEGNSTGCHLHLEVHPNAAAAVDPLTWLDSHGATP